MSIQAVIFDLGGVLLRTEDRSTRHKLAERFGISYAELEELVFFSTTGKLASVGRVSSQQHWQTVAEELGISSQEIENFQKEYFEGDRLDMEMIDFIRSLRKEYRTALLTNAWDNLRSWLEELGVSDAFDHLIISAELGLAKPDPRLYNLALEQIGVKAEQAILVDDFIENVEGARSVGMQAILFKNPSQARKELAALLGVDKDQG